MKSRVASSVPIASQFIERKGNDWLCVASACMQGKRDNMEDTHRISLSLRGHANTAFFGVYDGHGGEESNAASQYLKAKLHKNLAKLNGFGSDEHKAIQQVVCDLDKQFLKSNVNRNHGSTATFVITQKWSKKRQDDICAPNLINDMQKRLNSEDPRFDEMFQVCAKNFQKDPQTCLEMMQVLKIDEQDVFDNFLNENSYLLTVGNVGDSRIMLGFRDGSYEMLTKDHKPEDEGEQERIYRCGGTVVNGRVDNILAISRTIGDAMFKNPEEGDVFQQKVIPVPDVSIHVAAEDDFLLLCCDGIYEHLTPSQVHAFVSNLMKKTKEPGLILSCLLDAALESGSADNMSAMLVFFHKGVTFNDIFIPGPCFDNRLNAEWMKIYTADARSHGIMDLKQLLRLAYSQEFRTTIYKPTKVALAKELHTLTASASIPDIVEMTSCKRRFPFEDNYTNIILEGGKRFSLHDLRKLIHIDVNDWDEMIASFPKAFVNTFLEVVHELAEYEQFWRNAQPSDREDRDWKFQDRFWGLFKSKGISRSEFTYIWQDLVLQNIDDKVKFRRQDSVTIHSLGYLPRHEDIIRTFVEELSLPNYRNALRKYFALHDDLGSFDQWWTQLLKSDFVEEKQMEKIACNGVLNAMKLLKSDTEIVDVFILAIEELLSSKVRKVRKWAFEPDSEFKFDYHQIDTASQQYAGAPDHKIGQLAVATLLDGTIFVGRLKEVLNRNIFIISQECNGKEIVAMELYKMTVYLVEEDPLDNAFTIELIFEIITSQNMLINMDHMRKVRSKGVDNLKDLEALVRRDDRWCGTVFDRCMTVNQQVKTSIEEFVTGEEKKRARQKLKNSGSLERARCRKVEMRIKQKRIQLRGDKMEICDDLEHIIDLPPTKNGGNQAVAEHVAKDRPWKCCVL